MMELRAMMGMLDPLDSSAEGIERQQVITRVHAYLSALAADNAVETQTLRDEEEAAREVPKSRRCNGLAAELGLASWQSPRGPRNSG